MWKREGAPASSRPFSSVIKGPEAKAEKERGLALVHALSLSIRCCSVFAPYAEVWMWDGIERQRGGGREAASEQGTFFSVRALRTRTQSVLRAKEGKDGEYKCQIPSDQSSRKHF